MGIEGGIVGNAAGGAPVSMELLQLIAADPAEFQRRMALIEQSKKEFDEQLEKNQLVGDIIALRKEAADAVDQANATLSKAKVDSEAMLAAAKTKAGKTISSAESEAQEILKTANASAAEIRWAAEKIMEDAQAASQKVQVREEEAKALKAAADEKYKSVEPDKAEFQRQTELLKIANAESLKTKTEYLQKRGELEAVAQQIAKALNGG
jgi:hypothetical protein